MAQEGTPEFVMKYAEILKETWTDGEDFKQRLLTEPEKVVKDFGLDPGTAKVTIITEVVAEGTIEDQIRLWEEGKVSGHINLYVPFQPPEDAFANMELTDDELEMVAGGGCCCAGCCTCTPCCSCCC